MQAHMRSIPPEITDRIIDYLHDDKAALARCSLVSSIWFTSSRYHLFRQVEITAANLVTFFLLFQKSRPTFPPIVQSLHINEGSDLERIHEGATGAVAQRLPHLACLRIYRAMWYSLDRRSIFAFRDGFKLITELHLIFVWIDDFAALIELLCSFPVLQSLTCDTVQLWRIERDMEPTMSPKHRALPSSLTNFSFARPEAALLNWMCSQSAVHNARSYKLLSWDSSQISQITSLLFLSGPSLKFLEISCPAGKNIEGNVPFKNFLSKPFQNIKCHRSRHLSHISQA